MLLTILFYGEFGQELMDELKVKNAEYSPNIGESVNSEKFGIKTFIVIKKEIFFYSDGTSHHIIFCTMNPSPFKIHS